MIAIQDLEVDMTTTDDFSTCEPAGRRVQAHGALETNA